MGVVAAKATNAFEQVILEQAEVVLLGGHAKLERLR